MNRIDAIFQAHRDAQTKALMPFVTAGDPSLPVTGELLGAMQDAGASVVEVGLPFSDPIADGPVIQASMTRALATGVRVEDIFETVAARRAALSIGLVAMVSYSIVHRMTLHGFVNDAVAAGFDGFIFPDLPVDEADDAAQAAREAGAILSQLVAPTSPDDRAARIAAACTGFVYVVSRAGITGEQASLPPELPDRLRALRGVTDLPMAVGFGVSSAEQVRQVVAVADAAIVGSAVVRRVHEHANDPNGPAAVGGFVRELAAGLTA